MAGLHAHQLDLVARVRAEYAAGRRSVVMQLATGGGKTHTAAHLLGLTVARGKRAIFVAHLDTLISDTAERLRAAGIPCGIVQADRPADPAAPVQVCSTATLHRRGDRPPADLVVLDECHRAAADSVRGILDAYGEARLLGLTATPQRGDGAPLGDVFESIVEGPSLAWLTERGYLAPAEVISPPAPTEPGTLAMDPIHALARWSPGGRAIIFASNVEHARQLVTRLGPFGRLLTGETPRAERDEIRAWVTEQIGRCVVNVAVCVEGWDAPAIDTVVLARPFGHVGSFLQAIGRGLRAREGKGTCIVLDLVGATMLHGLPSDPRRWSLEGEASRRTGAGVLPLQRCLDCLAVFPPAARCPRCGAGPKHQVKLPRVLSREERLEVVQRVPLDVRERSYRAVLERRFGASRMPPWIVARKVEQLMAKWRERNGVES